MGGTRMGGLQAADRVTRCTLAAVVLCGALLAPGAFAGGRRHALQLDRHSPAQSGSFVRVAENGMSFETEDGVPYNYVGANYWYGANLASIGPGGNRTRLLRELDQMQSLGLKNLRVMAASEGPNYEPFRIAPAMQTAPGEYDYEVLDGMDFLLSEMSKRGMKAVLCLANFWAWSGGLGQYLQWAGKSSFIPYHDPGSHSWNEYSTFTANAFRSRSTTALYHNHVKFMVERYNPYLERQYKDDATIMAWELANEPRGMKYASELRRWAKKTAELIKSLDQNHLVTVGVEGNTPYPSSGVDFEALHGDKNVDYATIHIWVENWSWFNPWDPEGSYQNALTKAKQYLNDHVRRAATSFQKPVVLEEFGIARDSFDASGAGVDRYHPSASVRWRDRYYADMLEEVCALARDNDMPMSGANIWAWGGDAAPLAGSAWQPGALWHPGQPWTGDPPHESQGWYSVYSTDTSTHQVLSRYAACLDKARTTSPPGPLVTQQDG